METQSDPNDVRELYRIPVHSAWFSWSSIHAIEKRGLPEFFDGRSQSKTGKIYKEYRDAIISKYREDPSRPVTFTDIRRLLVGDVNSIRRVFEFLDHWGLINYHAKPIPGPLQWSATPVGLLEAEPSGIRIVKPSVTPSQSLLNISSSTAATESQVTPIVGVPSTLPSAPGSADSSVQFKCGSCSQDCSAMRYHSLRQADFDLCVTCYNQAKFPATMAASDFLLLAAARPSSDPSAGIASGGKAAADAGGEWSDEESLLLLEALELYGDRWEDVAEHVGSTRSKAECIARFLQLPIREPLLHGLSLDPRVGRSKQEATSKRPRLDPESGKEEPLIPFADVGNPVMAQVSFLCSLVGAPIAAAAAKAALTALSEESQGGGKGALLDPSGGKISAGPDSHQKPLPLRVPPSSQIKVEAANGESQPAAAADAQTVESAAQEAEAKEPQAAGSESEIGPERMRQAAAVALSAAAVKAKLMADEELRSMHTLLSRIIHNQVKKVELKLQHFESLEVMLSREREAVERQRQQLFAEKLHLASIPGPGPGPSPASAPSAATGARFLSSIAPSSALGSQPATHGGSGINAQTLNPSNTN